MEYASGLRSDWKIATRKEPKKSTRNDVIVKDGRLDDDDADATNPFVVPEGSSKVSTGRRSTRKVIENGKRDFSRQNEVCAHLVHHR